MDTICSSLRPWLSCYGICLINTPPNRRYRQPSASILLAVTARQPGDFRPLWSSYFVVCRRQNLITGVEGHYRKISVWIIPSSLLNFVPPVRWSRTGRQLKPRFIYRKRVLVTTGIGALTFFLAYLLLLTIIYLVSYTWDGFYSGPDVGVNTSGLHVTRTFLLACTPSFPIGSSPKHL